MLILSIAMMNAFCVFLEYYYAHGLRIDLSCELSRADEICQRPGNASCGDRQARGGRGILPENCPPRWSTLVRTRQDVQDLGRHRRLGPVIEGPRQLKHMHAFLRTNHVRSRYYDT